MCPETCLESAHTPHMFQESRQPLKQARLTRGPDNIPDGDPLYQCLNLAFDNLLLVSDLSDDTWCTGTGFVLRHSAAEQIGGIPTDQLSEDIMTSLLLFAKGWKVAYVWEPLQWGLVPDSFAGCARQATRWAKGLTSIALAVFGPRLANLSLGKRFEVALSAIYFVGPTFALAFGMVFIPTVLIIGNSFVHPTLQQLQNLLVLSALQLFVTWFNGLLAAEASGFRTPIWPPYRSPCLAPFESLAILGLIFPFPQSFTPSGNPKDGEREREAMASTSLMKRLRFLFKGRSSWFYLFVVTSTILSATLCLKAAFSNDLNSQHRLQQLFVGVAWPPAFVHWAMFIVECWKPIAYAIFPRRRRPREALLNRDPTTNLAYPSDFAKDGKRIGQSQGFPLVILAYDVLVLGCSWALRFE